jgi:hypothetical protein
MDLKKIRREVVDRIHFSGQDTIQWTEYNSVRMGFNGGKVVT